MNMKHITRKATRHISQNEGLIFEKSSPGKAAWKLPPLDVPEVDTAKLLGKQERKDLGDMPEVSEIEIIRHFTRLSTWNYAIDLGMYPLGSCTMKYNPRVNELVARVEGLANGHPYQAEKISQGALQIMKTLSDCLLEITGMDAITLQPAAGAQGELTGLLMVRAYHQSQGNARKKILTPDSAHGTNPASAATVGYAVENLKSNDRGMVDVASLAAQMNEDVAALMVTNPNTLGRVRARNPQDRRPPARKGRPALHGWREHECAGRQGAAGRFRRGCDAPEPAQNFFYAAWRRRSGIGPGGGEEDACAVSADSGRHHQGRWHAGI